MIDAPADPVDRAWWHLELCPELFWADQREQPDWGAAPLEFDDDWDGEYSDDRRVCPYCKGDGGDPWNDYILECPQCLGEGVLW